MSWLSPACADQHPGHVICILKGDVKGAFRHLMLASRHVRWMGARVSQCRALIVDMSAPFGWTGSPSFYGVFGSEISWLVGRESPATILGTTVASDDEPFFPYEWVDDHIMVEVDTPGRLRAAEMCLRLAMMAVLGPRAINEAKFSTWSTNIEVLGLEFNTTERTVTMPQDKLDKAAARVARLQRASTTSRHELQCLLGSLRHVTCILRSAKPFFQRIQSAAVRAPSRGRIPISDPICADLRWFRHILEYGAWSGLPTSMFNQDPPIDVHWYMDASDSGLAVLDPSQQRFIQLDFDDDERSMIRSVKTQLFNINVRELMCVTLAAVLWGQDCSTHLASQMTHVRPWSDNTSAVTWANRLHSDNPFAQELLRAIGLCEVTQRFRVSAGHLPGKCNVLADAGSRQNTDRLARIWTNTTGAWTQTTVPARFRKIYRSFSASFNPEHWPTRATARTLPPGDNGTHGADPKASLPGLQATASATRPSSSGLPSSAGAHHLPPEVTRPAPFCPRLATLAGFINDSVASPSDSTRATYWPCAGCRGCHHHLNAKNRSPSHCSDPCATSATSTQRMTASCGGLRSWAFSLC
jgi:hypothetical protein